jgi:hypothetical protein
LCASAKRCMSSSGSSHGCSDTPGICTHRFFKIHTTTSRVRAEAQPGRLGECAGMFPTTATRRGLESDGRTSRFRADVWRISGCAVGGAPGRHYRSWARRPPTAPESRDACPRCRSCRHRCRDGRYCSDRLRARELASRRGRDPDPNPSAGPVFGNVLRRVEVNVDAQVTAFIRRWAQVTTSSLRWTVGG